jgi:hypothetical protein
MIVITMTKMGILLLLLGATGAATFGYSLTQQTSLQARMNQAMASINSSITATTGLVGETATALQPLGDTTVSLGQVETHESKAVRNLASMNDHLRRIGTVEQQIVGRLDSLNGTMGSINGELDTLSGLNGQLLERSTSSTSQARTEANLVGSMNGMTDTTIAQLHRMNSKLSALRLLP